MDMNYLTEEKRRLLGELEDWVLECPEVSFCGAAFDTRDGSVRLVVGGASATRMGITAGAWLARMQESLPGMNIQLQIVRGKLRPPPACEPYEHP